jgi:hypothetical protein
MMFKHPKYYKNLRKLYRSRNRDQAISRGDATAAGRRAPGTGLKQQASSSEGSSEDLRSDKPQATSSQASSDKLQAPSNKRQAPSRKRQAL